MSVLIYTESEQGKFKKVAFEVASYAKAIAKQLDTTVTAVAINVEDTSALAAYGVDKVLKVNEPGLEGFNAKVYANVIKQASEKENTKVVVLSSSANSKYLAPLLAVQLNAGYASNVVDVPTSVSPFTVKRTAFTNKAFEFTQINTDVKIIGLSNNSFGLVESTGNATEDAFKPSLVASEINVESVDKVKGKVAIADADIVVSGGRGLKGPENWGMIEELAD